MNTGRWGVLGGVAVLLALAGTAARADEGKDSPPKSHADSVMEQIREGAHDVAARVRVEIKRARAEVDRMGAEARVYARLHWDKALADAKLDVEVQKDGAAVLRGTVASEAGKAKAGILAQDTVGIQRVENDLMVVPPAAPR